jgi:hypothetical protein
VLAATQIAGDPETAADGITRQLTAAGEATAARGSRRRMAVLAAAAALGLAGMAVAFGLFGGGDDAGDADPGARTAGTGRAAAPIRTRAPAPVAPVDAGSVAEARDAAPAEAGDAAPAEAGDAAPAETAAPLRIRPPTPQRRATLSVITQPWSTVTLDGKRVGNTTPIRDLPVAPGRHRLVLHNPIKNLSKEVVITLKPGEIRLVSERLE